jgi:glycosyltransferase involved in cell wall biosynthesis
MNYLIVDLNIQFDGHKFGFVQETINWLVKNEDCKEHNFHFLVNQQMQSNEASNIVIEVLSEGQENNFNTKKSIWKYKEQWNYIKLKANQFNASKVILMEFDIYQIAIGNDSNSGFDISGIWFRPYHRQVSKSKSLFNQVKFNFVQWRKKLTFRLALRNNFLKQVFVLNDNSTVNALNQNFDERLCYLPDPVFEIEEDIGIDIFQKYNIGQGKVIFLLFGYIDDRKNVLNIIKALKGLPNELKSKASLLIIGKMSEKYAVLLNQLKSDEHLQIVQNNDFVSDAEMNALFMNSDLILRMNVNFFASSGILGLAARHNKPSIVSDYGVVADLTEEYSLGRSVDPLNVKALSSLFMDFIENKHHWNIDGQKYYVDHNTEAFVKTLLDL